MPARSGIRQAIFKTVMLISALFVVTMLLAAIPSHRTPVQVYVPPQESAQDSQQAQQQASASQESMPAMDHGKMPGMEMSEDAKVSEHAAVEQMAGMTGNINREGRSLHMFMTHMRPQQPADVERTNEIVTQLRAGIEKFRDYHVALNEGYRIFLPNLPQKEYHFTNYKNGFLETFTFDPARPTSLLYKKTATGYELVGAMYTMPKSATEDELDARVPLSIAMWHLHTNLCMPPRSQFRNADWSKFGLKGSIASQEACDAAGGRFSPVVFGWMVHVYPYENSLDKIFAMHHATEAGNQKQ